MPMSEKDATRSSVTDEPRRVEGDECQCPPLPATAAAGGITTDDVGGRHKCKSKLEQIAKIE